MSAQAITREIDALDDHRVESVRRVRKAWSRTRVEALGAGMDSWHTVDPFGRYISGPAWRLGRLTDAHHDLAARVRREVTNKLQTGLKQPRAHPAP